ncbi:xanthine dehydrogenase family protein molybdopterin-binding subunit [Limnoglobus roseus]|uniref:Xanthine dehydrogenase YagR molybdenum-binding subunit n=1 Tax=Limnoglobus roseus TaxID=2598579 RepID=A0A5C1ARH0_9BACT|nr:xanthine dehydrogenase family protein molybdopterin-binding subunit [Limnoglobus roseus]QEL20663.1 Putative xanthine dehydrogenase YagR molybdenum-binding subunit [Limnoglobus roseus]
MSTTAVGKPMDRVDGRLKVTGAARYAAEHDYPNLAHAVLVTSTISKGTIAEVVTAAAVKARGVAAVVTHKNAPKMKVPEPFGGEKPSAGSTTAPVLNTDQVFWFGQPVAIVIAETLEQARHAAQLVRVTYQEQPANLTLDSAGKVTTPKKIMTEATTVEIGHAERALKAATLKVDAVYETPQFNHNAIELHATVAAWDGGKLTVHDTAQFVFGVQADLATRFGLKPADVRALAPLVGGGFGGKGVAWPSTYLAPLAAKVVGRPVKLVLARDQIYGCVGGRPPIRQRVAVAADKDGKLTALIQAGRSATGTTNQFVEQFTFPARHLYACPNIYLTQETIALDTCPPTFMRAPGECPGTFALESALDELSYQLKIDPVRLRQINEPDKDPTTGAPFSNRKYQEALALGAEKFGWNRRTPEPRSMADGRMLVGLGMATATYPVYRMPGSARVAVSADGTAVVQSGCHEMGMGTATAQTQIAADLLGLPVEKVRFELGDTNLPFAMVAGGSSQTISVAAAVSAAVAELKGVVLKLATAGPLEGLKPAAVAVRDGGLYRTDDPASGESFASILQRAGRKSAEAKAEVMPGAEMQKWSMHSYGAQFCEVRVDPDFGTVRVVRFVGAFDVGRVMNAKTARSQFLGGITMGLGMALLEETHRDGRTGRIVNADLAEYMVPVHADVPAIEAYWVGDPDPHTPMGAHGIGEIGITGVAAAVANAVYHATGRRVRRVPITPERLLAAPRDG